MQYVDELMGLETNFDIIHRVIRLGDTDACMYLIDGFCKDELMQKNITVSDGSEGGGLPKGCP